MTTALTTPLLQLFDLDGKPLTGGRVYIGLQDQNPVTAPKAVFWDAAGTQPAAQPLDTLGGLIVRSGTPAQVFVDGTHSILVLDAESRQVFYAPKGAELAGLAGNLAASTSATLGAGLVGYSTGQSYGSGTVGAELRKIGTKTIGTLSAGTTVDLTLDKTLSGASGGTSDFRHIVEATRVTGSNALAQVNGRNVQIEINATGGVTSVFGTQSYIRSGFAGVGAVAVTSMRVHDSHIANEGTGNVGTATNFFADEVDLLAGTGTIDNVVGFYAGNQGHATRVTARAVGFRAGNMTAGAPFTAGFHSEMQDGTNKWAFYSEGNAPSVFTGKVGIGSATRPVDAFEVFQGYAKLCGSTTKLADGSYHEMRSANNTFIAKFTSTNASTPEGLHMKFTAANPNNTTERFLLLDDQAATRLVIWSNGDVVNANNSYGAVSDARLKTDIRDAGSQWADVAAMRLRKFKLRDTDFDQLGLIAQELEATSPGLVYEGGDGFKGVKYSVIALKLLGVVQEMQRRIETLEAQVSV